MLQTVTIQFPEITLKTRDAHKLRGYFGNLFKDHSPLLHNHYETGELRYKYPLVQYKVLNGTPTLVALQEGAQLLTQLFLKIKELNIDGNIIPIHGKNIRSEMVRAGYSSQLHEYSFQTLWMGLNQNNYAKYAAIAHESERKNLLDRIITGNILSCFKGLGIKLTETEKLMVKSRLQEKTTRFKDKDMVAFSGDFVVNALLPQGIGIGKGVSRGFGAIMKI